MSSLLEQAIIDAKQLRETALQNAENIVIEKYSEEVKANVQSLLEQEEKQPKEKVSDVARQIPDAYFKPIDEEVPVIIDLDELDAQLKREVVKESLALEGEDCLGEGCVDLEPEATDRFGRDVGGRTPDPSTGRQVLSLEDNDFNFGEEEDQDTFDHVEEEFELDEAILEMYAVEDDEDDQDYDEGEESDEEDSMLEEFTNEPDPGHMDLEETTSELEEEVLNNLYEKLSFNIDDIGRSGWGNLGVPDIEVEEMQSMIDALEETLAEDSEEKEELKNENIDLRHAGVVLQENNDNLRKAVGILKEKLEQTNVSNAKLLYINQAIGNASLNERQKDKIVEAISRAESVKEAKVIYETLQGTVGQDTYKSPLPQSLSEVVSSKSSSMLMAGRRPENNKRNPLKDRMQILAGIK